MVDLDSIFKFKHLDDKTYNNLTKKLIAGNPDECWLWNASINKLHNRPMFWFKDSWTPAARAVVYFKQGYLTDGMHVCHDPVICNNKSCVNPFHLREDTPSANIIDLKATGMHNNHRKTHCPKNHEYNKENTYYHNGRRYCRACKANYGRTK